MEANNSSIIMQQDNKEELVHQMWERLGVGSDGFLTLEDLTKVCHAINMENNVNELFARLDLDGDGKISFGEFLHLFQKGFGEQTAMSPTPSSPGSTKLDSVPQMLQAPVISFQKRSSSSMSSICTSSLSDDITSSNILPLLLPKENNTAAASLPVWRVVQHWEQHGVSEGLLLLQELGFTTGQTDMLVLQDLISAVEEECQAMREGNVGTRYPRPRSQHPKQALTMLLLQETKYLRQVIENALCERDKLKSDLMVTSQRLSSQAQELDDQSLALEVTAHQHIQSVEKQHQETIRSLQERLISEREAREQAVETGADMTQRISILNEQVCKLKAVVDEASAQCEKLELENAELRSKLESSNAVLSDAHALNNRLKEGREELNMSVEYKEERKVKITEVVESEWQEVLKELAKVRQDNHSLRDTNDELLARIDQLTIHSTPLATVGGERGSSAMKHPNCIVGLGEITLDGSCIGDYLKTSVNVSQSTETSSLTVTTPVSSKLVSRSSSTNLSSRLKRASSEDRDSPPSPRDVSSADRRSSPDLLSPRAGKIARCSASTPPPGYTSNPYDTAVPANDFNSSSQPASLELNLCSLGSFRGESMSVRDSLRHVERRVASTSSVAMGLSISSGSLSPSVSAPQSARRGGALWSKGGGGGLECELADVRVEVSSLLQHRDHLAACVASLQRQYDNMVSQINSWEQSIRTVTREVTLSSSLQGTKDTPITGDTVPPLASTDPAHTTTSPKESEDSSSSSNMSTSHDESPRVKLVPTNLAPLLSNLHNEVKLLRERESDSKEKLMKDLNESEREKAKVFDRNNQLETELQASKVELDKSEEYWLLKIQEEQDYYEEERKVYDDNFAKLEAKIADLENGPGKQRLTPIDESVMYEEQVLALEKELVSMEDDLTLCIKEKDAAVKQLEQLQQKYKEVVNTKSKTLGSDSAETQVLTESPGRMCESAVADSRKKQLVPMSTVTDMYCACRDQQRAKVDGLEAALEIAQQHLHHHNLQHVEQMRRAEFSDNLLKNLYQENAELMHALSVTEGRQKEAEGLLRALQHRRRYCVCSSGDPPPSTTGGEGGASVLQ